MTDQEFLYRLEPSAQGVDAARWKLAELAADARAAEYPFWAEKIGRYKHVRRSPRTVREWQQAADFRRSLDGQADGLPFSFYALASRFTDRLELKTILELMAEFSAEAGADFETFRAQLKTLAEEPESSPKSVKRSLESIIGRCDKLATTFGLDKKVLGQVNQAMEYLESALGMVEDA